MKTIKNSVAPVLTRIGKESQRQNDGKPLSQLDTNAIMLIEHIQAQLYLEAGINADLQFADLKVQIIENETS